MSVEHWADLSFLLSCVVSCSVERLQCADGRVRVQSTIRDHPTGIVLPLGGGSHFVLSSAECGGAVCPTISQDRCSCGYEGGRAHPPPNLTTQSSRSLALAQSCRISGGVILDRGVLSGCLIVYMDRSATCFARCARDGFGLLLDGLCVIPQARGACRG